MSKNANTGELRTPVYFKKLIRTIDDEGFPTEKVESLFKSKEGEELPCMCKWVNAHGSEVLTAMTLKLRDSATLTTRFSPLLDDEKLIIYRNKDNKPYEVISIDNVEQKDIWLEIKVQRKVDAR